MRLPVKAAGFADAAIGTSINANTSDAHFVGVVDCLTAIEAARQS